MTPRIPAAAVAIRWLVVLAATIATIALVASLHRGAPTRDQPYIVDAAPDPDDPASELVTCRRRLPDVTDVDVDDLRQLDPVGRVTSSEVIECPELFDGQVTVYIGEVIGDVLQREGGAWVLMNDGPYALEVGPLPVSRRYAGTNAGLSVWLPEDVQELVDQPGGPDWRGDILRVRGVIRRTDPADGGGLTFRAFEGEVVAEAEPLDHPLDRAQLVAALALSLIAAGVVVWERLAARSR